LARYETVRSLEQVADKLDKLAKAQLELALQSGKHLKDQQDRLDPDLAPFRRTQLLMANRLRPQELKQLAAEQKNVQRDFDNLLKQAADLKAQLPPEQKELVDKLDAAAQSGRVAETLHEAGQRLEALDKKAAARQAELLPEANALQRKAAEDLKDLVALLRQ